LWTIFLVLGVTTFIFEKENIWLILLSGLAAWLIRTKPKLPASNSIFLTPFFLQVATVTWTDSKLLQMAGFFLKAGAFVFGSGLAIIPFLYGGVVKEYQWLNDQEFLDAVAIAMITPGPVVITVGFIGFLVAGFPGACVAALATFLPCYLFTILPAPYFRKYGRHPAIRAIVDGVTAAAIGAIAGAVVVLAKRQFTDITSILIAAVVIIILIRFKTAREPLIIFYAALAGIIIKLILR
jgi:chromate transporter